VRVDSKKRLAKGNETGNVENGICCELVKLHAIDKEERTKKLMGRKRKAVEKPGGLGMRSSPGKMIGADSGRRPSFLAFFRLDSSNDEGTHLVDALLLPFSVNFSLCATFLMGSTSEHAQGLRGECKRKGGEAMVATEE
jgi:hypothetical protein